MQKKTKLGIAATSLAAAATVMTPGSAAATGHCDLKICPDPGVDAFHKIEDTFHKIEGFAEPLAAELERVFLKLEDVFIKIE